MNAYQLKRMLLAPYIRVMRFAHRRTAEPVRGMLELFYYKPSFYRIHAAYRRKPDLLWDAPGMSADSIVFDVGGYVGDWSESVWQKYQPNIYCFEIDPVLSRGIEQRFQDRPKVRCLDYGLGRQDETLKLTRSYMGSTVHADAAPADTAGAVEVQVRDIVAVMNELQLDQIDWMKLNIEGAEYDLLERLIEADRLRDVRVLTVQFHEWFDGAQGRRRRIRDALRRTHRQAWNYPFIWEQWVRQ